MVRVVRTLCPGFVLLSLVAMLAGCGGPSGPSIKAEDVWARPAMVGEQTGESSAEGMAMGKGAPGTGAVYMRLVNEGQEADRLLGGQTDVAEVVEIHHTVMEGEVMKMQRLAGGLEVPARGEVLLKPGSFHVMLIGLVRDLKVGDTFPLELVFERSGSITVEPEVREP